MNNEQEIKKLEKEIEGLETKRACIEQQIDDKVEKIERLKNKTRYYLNTFGEVGEIVESWDIQSVIYKMDLQGHVFDSLEDAEKERDRRALLYEFNQFKNECNNGWTPDWKDFNTPKYFIAVDSDGYLKSMSMYCTKVFVKFGYFRNYEDCMDAIKKFGDRIKKLYID